MNISRREFFKSLLALAGTPLYRKLLAGGGIGALLTALTPTPARAVGPISPYSPFGFDWGVRFRQTANFVDQVAEEAEGDDYNLGTAYGAGHYAGFPNQGFTALTDLSAANFTVGTLGLPLDPRNAGSVRNANNGTQSAFQMDLSDSGAADPDGTRTFAIIVALGQAGTSAPNTANFTELVDGATAGGIVLATRDGNPTSNELGRFGGSGFGGAAQTGLPLVTPLSGNLLGWPNSIKPEVYTFASDLLTIRLGPGTPPGSRSGDSCISYIRVRRVHPSLLSNTAIGYAAKAQWETQMRRVGYHFRYYANSDRNFHLKAAQITAEPTLLEKYNLSAIFLGGASPAYYDALKVWCQIYAYTGDPAARAMCDSAFTVAVPYLNQFFEGPAPNGREGEVITLNLFTTGMRMYHDLLVEENGSENATSLLAKSTAIDLRRRCGYSDDAEMVPGHPNRAVLFNANASGLRESSYPLTAHIDAELLGHPPSIYLTDYRDILFNLINHICVTKDFIGLGGTYPGQYNIQPFQLANGLVGLIRYAEHTGDMSVLGPIRSAIDFLWDYCWVPNMPGGLATDTAFGYHLHKSSGGGAALPFNFPADAEAGISAHWLNLLIVQPWGWYYHHTGDTTIRDQAIAIFSGGVVPTSPNSTSVSATYDGGPVGKTFNQNYVKSFEFVEWMDMALASASGAKTLGLGAGKTLSIKAGKSLSIKAE